MRTILKIMLVVALYSLWACNSSHEHADTHTHGEEESKEIQEMHQQEQAEASSHTHNQEAEHSHNEEIHNHDQAETTHDGHDHANEEEHSHEEQEVHDHEESMLEEAGHADHSSGEHQHESDLHDVIVVKEVRKGHFHQVIKTAGELETLPKSTVGISAPANGFVILAGADILPGKTVKNGELLFTITGGSLSEENLKVRYQNAASDYQLALKNYERAKVLFADQIISEKEYIQHQSDYEKAKTIYENRKANFSQGGIRVYASMTGYISDIQVREGDFVNAGQRLVSIRNDARLMLRADLEQKYSAALMDVQGANFETPDGKMHATRDLNPRLLSVGKSVNEESFYIPVFFEIDKREGFYPGSFVHVYLITESVDDVVTIPKTALIEEQGKFYVFVEEDGTFHKTAIKKGISDGFNVVVESGLHEGDHVVIEGAYEVKLANMSSSLPAHSHSH